MFSYDFKKTALNALKGKWGLAVLTGLVAVLLTGDSLINFNIPESIRNGDIGMRYGMPHIGYEILMFASGFVIAYAILILIVKGITEIGYSKFNLNLIRGENPQFTDIFSYYSYIFKGIGLTVIRGIFVFLWSLLFVIPGIVAVYRYAMMPYIIAEDPDIPIMEAMRKSKEMMYGNKGRLFCLHLSFIGWAILAALTAGIGLLWLNPYIAASEASFYESLKPDVLEIDSDVINWNE